MEGSPNSTRWELVAGPERIVPWDSPDVSAAWLWTMRRRDTGQIRELAVRVTWRGFDSIDHVPSRLTKEAFATEGRPGAEWFLASEVDEWMEVIFHAQTRTGPHGSTGGREIVRL